MKKLIIMLVVTLVLTITSSLVSAQEIEQQNRVQDPATHAGSSPSPTGNQVQNQNQVNAQNQGEDSQLQINTQEQENLEDGQEEGLQNRNQNAAIRNMNEVAKQVQQLLQVRTAGGIGEQVRQIAQEQNRAQTQIQEQLNKLESKNGLAKFFSGTDYGAVKNLKVQLVQNQVRIRQLEQLQNQLSNQEDITMVQAAVRALIQENTSLQERITAEEQVRSIFGWLFKLFAN